MAAELPKGETMKLFRNVLITGMLLVILSVSFSSAYARSTSIVTHGSFTILPRSEDAAPLNAEIQEPGISEITKETMTTVETEYAGKIIYTTVGTL